MKISVQEVSWHRNGISGVGFYAVRFKAEVGLDAVGKKDANWLGILFDTPGECAVICLDLLETCGVKFGGGNSWRGDAFETELREAIKNMQSSGSVRVGPFGLPT